MDQDNVEHKLKQYIGKWVVLYFYPKDDTTGCTKEACTITDVYKDFKRMGVTVMGVSKDTVKSHKKFAEKFKLNFPILADDRYQVTAKYGVLTNFMGMKVARRRSAPVIRALLPAGAATTDQA